MARIRTIKPEFFTSESIAAIRPYRARLTFVGLWTHATDQGRCRDNAKLIKAAVWPLEDDVTVTDVEDDLTTLAQLGRIIRYHGTPAGGDQPVPLLQIVNFSEHQKINRPSNRTTLPGPDDPEEPPPNTPLGNGAVSNAAINGILTEGSVSPTGGLTEVDANGQVTRDSGTAHGGLTEGSVRTHGALTGGTGNREQGTGRGERAHARTDAAAPPPARCRRHADLPPDDPGPNCVGCGSVRERQEREAEELAAARVQAARDAQRARQLAERNAPRPEPGPGRELARAELAAARARKEATA